MSQHEPLVINSRRNVRRSVVFDDLRPYHSDKPTPSKIAAFWKEVDAGDISSAPELMEELEGKDGTIQSVAARRREALTALDWSIEPGDETTEAVEAAEFVEETLKHVSGWALTLEHFSTAIGPGVAATELIWRNGRLVATNDVPGARLWEEDGKVRIRTDNEAVFGVVADLGKFAIHVTNPRAGHPMRVNLLRPTATLWVIKHHAIADFVSFSEIFGIPVRHATYTNETPDQAKTEAKEMLERMGPDTWGLFHESVKLAILESAKGTHPGEVITEMVDKRLAILWLGQTLTTDVGDRGSFAAARVHENVKASILLSDIQNERRTIEDQIISPMVRIRWPGRVVALPRWKRVTFETKNLDADRVTMDKIRLFREMDLPLVKEWVYDSLGVPRPKGGEDVAIDKPTEMGFRKDESG